MVYDYDALYRLTHEAITFPTNSAKNRTTDYTYDKVGNRLQMVVRMVGQTPSCTTTVEYQYDALDRLTQETRTVILAAGEFEDGRHYAVNYGDGTQQVVAAPRRRPEPSAMAGYGLYALTGVTLMTLLTPIFLIWPRAPGQRRRLRRRRCFTVATALLMLPCIVVGPKEVQALHHEAALYQIVAALPAECIPAVSTITYQYDANGNMTRRDRAANDADVYVYDFENRLTELQHDDGASPVTQAEYDYDADGIRRQKTDTPTGTVTKFLTDKNRPYAQVLEERDGADVHQVWYTYGDDLIAQTRSVGGASDRSYYLYDGQLSVRQLTDAPANPNTTPVTITDWYEYDAFGSLLDSGGATVNDYRYTGEQYDPNSGFYYLRARFYDQGIGRFISRDSFAGSVSEPFSLHKYLYAYADPVDNRDPSGEYTLVGVLTAVSVISILASVILPVLAGAIFAAKAGTSIGDYLSELFSLSTWKEAAVIVGLGLGIGFVFKQIAKSLSTTVFSVLALVISLFSLYQSFKVVETFKGLSRKQLAHALALETAIAITAALTFSVAKRFRANPLDKIKYTDKVRRQMADKNDTFHSFPPEVERFARNPKITRFKGGDGIMRSKLEIEGHWDKKDGVFEWILEPDGRTVNHRRFRTE
ncbi:MAG: RHS repeat-associated core domain-containing protein [Phycisphaerae bacterium]